MKTNFSKSTNRRSSDSIKWNLYPEEVLPLWVADSDYPAPSTVLNEIENRVQHGIFGYARPQDSTKFAIKKWLEKRHQWTIDLDDILILPGVVQGFNFPAAAFSKPGDSVLIQTPAYHPLLQVAENNHLNCNIHNLSQTDTGRYEINIDD